MIEAKEVTFKYKKKTVFEDFSLSFDNGKVYGLLGKNGAGKSTLLYLMIGLLQPRKGKIFYNNENVSKRLPSVLSDIFIVPEEFMLPNVKLKRYMSINKSFYPKFSEEQLRENLSHFELDNNLNINLGSLSMGQKKKVFMSFALATNTSLLIMDEPTNGLDIPGKSQFKKFIASNMTDERTVIISTHQVQDIEKLIEHVVILENKSILLDASATDICRNLYFANGAGHIEHEKAFYVSQSFQGYNALLPNEGEEESILNLETLFNAVLENPGKIKSLFNRQNLQL
ncbi:MAG: ATP-binding cassette domain-containing protein [Tannerella sp.]|jgi:ABC-2 type transport system ATP-binding protein|nr:ATP-binding cassette domain-containing protein [Tannerella sp.]